MLNCCIILYYLISHVCRFAPIGFGVATFWNSQNCRFPSTYYNIHVYYNTVLCWYSP